MKRALLEPKVAPREILEIPLVLEAHYHGDTALCAFGPGLRYLLAYREAIADEAWPELEERSGERLIALSESDAQRYAANSFTLTTSSDANAASRRSSSTSRSS